MASIKLTNLPPNKSQLLSDFPDIFLITFNLKMKKNMKHCKCKCSYGRTHCRFIWIGTVKSIKNDTAILAVFP